LAHRMVDTQLVIGTGAAAIGLGFFPEYDANMRQERFDFIIKRTDCTFVRLHPEASGGEAHPLYSQSLQGPWLTAAGVQHQRKSIEDARAKAHSGGTRQGSGGVLAPAVGPWEPAPWESQASPASSQPPALQPPPQPAAQAPAPQPPAPQPSGQDHSGGDSQPAVACVVPHESPPTRAPPALAADTNPQADSSEADRKLLAKLLVAEPPATAPGGSQASQPAGASGSQAAQLADVADEPASGGAAVPAMGTWQNDDRSWWGSEWPSERHSRW